LIVVKAKPLNHSASEIREPNQVVSDSESSEEDLSSLIARLRKLLDLSETTRKMENVPFHEV
jgi:hypothetical protein